MGDTVLAAWAPTEATSNSVDGSYFTSSFPGAKLDDARWARGGNGTQGNLRTYAHCARSLVDPAVVGLPMEVPPGAVALMLLNLDGDSSVNYEDDAGADNRRGTKSVRLHVVDTPQHSGVGAGAYTSDASRNHVRWEWHLTADGALDSHAVCLNGQALSPDPKTGALPLPLAPRAVSGLPDENRPLSLSGLSAVFVLLPNAAAEACI
jgi:hypothetical protein